MSNYDGLPEGFFAQQSGFPVPIEVSYSATLPTKLVKNSKEAYGPFLADIQTVSTPECDYVVLEHGNILSVVLDCPQETIPLPMQSPTLLLGLNVSDPISDPMSPIFAHAAVVLPSIVTDSNVALLINLSTRLYHTLATANAKRAIFDSRATTILEDLGLNANIRLHKRAAGRWTSSVRNRSQRGLEKDRAEYEIRAQEWDDEWSKRCELEGWDTMVDLTQENIEKLSGRLEVSQGLQTAVQNYMGEGATVEEVERLLQLESWLRSTQEYVNEIDRCHEGTAHFGP